MEEAGYGVESYYGGYPFIQDKTFVSNRHCGRGSGVGFGIVRTLTLRAETSVEDCKIKQTLLLSTVLFEFFCPKNEKEVQHFK
jgi:hypothetical protein